MAIDYNKEKKKLAQMKQRSSSTWKPESGEENIIRILTFKHKITKEDVKAGMFPKDNLGKSSVEWDREIVRQFGFTDNNAPIIANAESLAKHKELASSSSKKDKVAAQKIRPSYGYLLNIVDINQEGEKTVQTWLAPKSVRIAVGDYLVDEDYGEDIFGVEGRDFKIKFDKEAQPAQMYKVAIRDEKHCKELDTDLEDKVKDFFDPDIYGAFGQDASDLDLEVSSTKEKEEDEPEEEEEEKPKKKSKKDDDDDELV